MQPDDVLGGYQIRRLIGGGAHADVYEAFDPRFDRTVALKVLKPHLRSNEVIVDRFLREARAAGALSHPHIVAYYDIETEDDIPFIALEYMPGPTLEQYRQEIPKPPLSVSLNYLAQLASALDYAHRAGRLHRDVKPSNILLSSDHTVVKLADFGVARIEDTDATASTQEGDIIGTLQYMSPEQYDDDAPVDGRADLFSLGIIAYELLTGRRPFDATTRPALMRQICEADPTPIIEIVPDIPVAVAEAVEKLLKKNPNDRWPTGRDFIEALQMNNIPKASELHTKRSSIRPQFMLAGLACVGILIGLGYWLLVTFEPVDKPTSADLDKNKVPPRVDSSTSTDRPKREPSGTAVVPPLPSIDTRALEDQANRTLAALPCSDLQARVDDRGVLSVQGSMGQPSSRSEVIATLRRLDGIKSVTASGIREVNDITCWLQVLIDRYASGPEVVLETNRPNSIFYEGDYLVVYATSRAQSDSHLYVDYFDPDGTVYHLRPNPEDTEANDTRLASGVRVQLGAKPGQQRRRYVVAPPFGQALVVGWSTPQPLFPDMRGESEQAVSYLRDLEKELLHQVGPIGGGLHRLTLVDKN